MKIVLCLRIFHSDINICEKYRTREILIQPTASAHQLGEDCLLCFRLRQPLDHSFFGLESLDIVRESSILPSDVFRLMFHQISLLIFQSGEEMSLRIAMNQDAKEVLTPPPRNNVRGDRDVFCSPPERCRFPYRSMISGLTVTDV